MSRRFRAQCLICPWISDKLNLGPVFALWDGMKHVNKEHPDSEGFVVAAEAITVRARTRYPCKEDDTRPCRESCREWMRSECDGQDYMLTADGGWIQNQIRLRKRMELSLRDKPKGGN